MEGGVSGRRGGPVPSPAVEEPTLGPGPVPTLNPNMAESPAAEVAKSHRSVINKNVQVSHLHKSSENVTYPYHNFILI